MILTKMAIKISSPKWK